MITAKDNLQGWKSVGGQVFPVTVYDVSTGAAYDLTGLTVTVSGRIGDTDQFRDLAVTLSATPTDGKFTFTPSAGEIGTAGVIEVQAKVDNGGAISLTSLLTITVSEAV
jgi:hypothetical protein